MMITTARMTATKATPDDSCHKERQTQCNPGFASRLDRQTRR